MRLTPKLREVLQRMADNEDDPEEGTLVQSVPGGWWIGNDHISGVTGNALLRLVLIREDSFSSEKMHHYTINEEGRKVLSDPDYTPEILAYLAERLRH